VTHYQVQFIRSMLIQH